MLVLKIIAFVLIIIGAIINYAAKAIANKMNLAHKVTVDEAMQLSEEELKDYKTAKAKVKVKLVGLLILLPGVLLVFYLFR